GIRRFDDLIGRMDLIDPRRAVGHYKAQGLDFSKLLYRPAMGQNVAMRWVQKQDHELDRALDHVLIEKAHPALENGQPVRIELPIKNVNRTVATMLSGEVAKRYGQTGLPEDT